VIPKIGPKKGKNIEMIIPINCNIILEGIAFHIKLDIPPFKPSITIIKPTSFCTSVLSIEGILFIVVLVLFLMRYHNDF
jgi:hypothetical protein